MIIENFYECQGQGPPIVFIHGSFATTSTWKKMVEHLAAEHFCISIKLPGHGGAPEVGGTAQPDVGIELEIIEKAVNSLTDEPIHLVGHSYGGTVAMAQAANGNLRIKELTLFEPVGVWLLDEEKDREMMEELNRFETGYRKAIAEGKPHTSGMLIDFWCGTGTFAVLPDKFKDWMETLVQHNLRHWDICNTFAYNFSPEQQRSLPTRVVCGNLTNPIMRTIGDRLCNQMTHSRKYIIDGASHFLVTTHAHDCLAALLDRFDSAS